MCMYLHITPTFMCIISFCVDAISRYSCTFMFSVHVCSRCLSDNICYLYLYVYFLLFLKKNGPFPASFFFIFVFSIQLTVNKCSINFADDWIWTADLWYWKRPVYQLSYTTTAHIFSFVPIFSLSLSVHVCSMSTLCVLPISLCLGICSLCLSACTYLCSVLLQDSKQWMLLLLLIISPPSKTFPSASLRVHGKVEPFGVVCNSQQQFREREREIVRANTLKHFSQRSRCHKQILV